MADGSEDGAKHPVVHIIGSGQFGSRIINIINPKAGTKMDAEYIYNALCRTRDGWFDAHGIDLLYGCYFHDNENTEKAVGKLFVEHENRGDAGCGPHGINQLNKYLFLNEQYSEQSKSMDQV